MTDADGDQNGCGGAFTLALEISENPKLPGGEGGEEEEEEEGEEWGGRDRD